jgi:hypothetical protein
LEVSAFALRNWYIWNFKLLENAGENSGHEPVTRVGRIVVGATPSDDDIVLGRILSRINIHRQGVFRIYQRIKMIISELFLRLLGQLQKLTQA